MNLGGNKIMSTDNTTKNNVRYGQYEENNIQYGQYEENNTQYARYGGKTTIIRTK